jgi:vacuolar-type H+-ATPase subunit F/Vma7
VKGDVRLLARPATAPALAPTGLPVLEAESGAAAAARLSKLADAPDAGVVLVEEALYESLPEETRRAIASRPLPMVVPFPGPVWATRPPAEAYVVELLRQAIGYRVRIR